MTPIERIDEFGGVIEPRLKPFFLHGYNAAQGAKLVGLSYASPLFVDFDGLLSEAWAETLEMLEAQGLDADTREVVTIDGRSYTPIAWLFAGTDDDEPESAYLVADVSDPSAPVYLADPSGTPERVAETFATFVRQLQP